jgi:hypothetical protein
MIYPQSNQSAGPVRFMIFCSISIFLLASMVAGRRHQCNAGAVQQGMYSTIPIHWNIKSAPASPGRSRVGPALYVFSFLGFTFIDLTGLQRIRLKSIHVLLYSMYINAGAVGHSHIYSICSFICRCNQT